MSEQPRPAVDESPPARPMRRRRRATGGSAPTETVPPEISRDESDLGWGDSRGDHDRDDWYRRERPPHHDG